MKYIHENIIIRHWRTDVTIGKEIVKLDEKRYV